MEFSLAEIQSRFGFTDTDLKTNKQGQLSESQIHMLKMRATSEFRATLIIPMMIVFSAFLFLEFTLTLPLLIIVALLAIGVSGLHQRRLKALPAMSVERVSGWLTKYPHHRQITVDQKAFSLSRERFDCLSEGEYDVYIIAETREVLGVEPKPISASSKRTKSSTQAA